MSGRTWAQRFDRVTCPECDRWVSVSWENQHGYVGLYRHYAPDGDLCPSVGKGYLAVTVELVRA